MRIWSLPPKMLVNVLLLKEHIELHFVLKELDKWSRFFFEIRESIPEDLAMYVEHGGVFVSDKNIHILDYLYSKWREMGGRHGFYSRNQYEVKRFWGRVPYLYFLHQELIEEMEIRFHNPMSSHPTKITLDDFPDFQKSTLFTAFTDYFNPDKDYLDITERLRTYVKNTGAREPLNIDIIRLYSAINSGVGDIPKLIEIESSRGVSRERLKYYLAIADFLEKKVITINDNGSDLVNAA